MKQIVYIRILMLTAVLMLPLVGGLRAQNTIHKNAAIVLLQQGNLDSALSEMNLYFKQPEAAKDADGYMLRGQVYKELFKKRSPNDPLTSYLDSAVADHVRALKFQQDTAQQRVIRRSLNYIASRYYNGAAQRLDSVHVGEAKACYAKYRTVMLIASPTVSLRAMDIEFYLAISTVYREIYEKDKLANRSYYLLTEEAYLKILELDPNNYDAHYRLSLLYWNAGVDEIFSIPLDTTSIELIEAKQDTALLYFRKALPHAERAYEIRPDRLETLIIIEGVYTSMNEFEKAESFGRLRRELEDKQRRGK